MRITESQLRRVVRRLVEQITDPETYLASNFTRTDGGHTEEPYGRYRGYSRGNVVFVKNDGTDVTPQDLSALQDLSWGQFTSVQQHKSDPTKIVVTFERDSGD